MSGICFENPRNKNYKNTAEHLYLNRKSMRGIWFKNSRNKNYKIPSEYAPEEEVDEGNLVEESDHLDDISQLVPVEAGEVGDDDVVLLPNLWSVGGKHE